jgi:hypothetical protein
MATVSVKIPVVVLIEKLEQRLATLNDEADAHAVALIQYVKDYHKFQAKGAQELLKKLQKAIEKDDYSDLTASRYGKPYVNMSAYFDSDFPEKPHYSAPTVRQGRKDISERSAIEQSLSILRLTNQETVGASVYGSFSHLF